METPPHVADRVILVRPTGFGHDAETAASNAFQRNVQDADIQFKAESEFDELLGMLDRVGVGVTVLDPPVLDAPNAVFPNNWFSTHADGTVVLYPMATPSRRRERDRDLDETLERHGFKVRQLVDLTALELDDRYLEGTGSLVIDRPRNVAFAALSPRTTERALNHWCGALRGGQVPFLATMDGTLAGAPVYHTNVVMSLGERFALICLEALPYPVDREDVYLELERTGREIIEIGLDQMHRYLGNLLELKALGKDDRFLFLSDAAYLSLRPEQRQRLQQHGQLVPVPVPTIEAVGGGSVRCMLAENFLEPLSE